MVHRSFDGTIAEPGAKMETTRRGNGQAFSHAERYRCPKNWQARIMRAHQFWLALALVCAIGATLADVQHKVQLVTSTAAQLPIEGKVPAIDGAIGWLNSPPLTTAGLRGKVVLIDFWTYTCVNWRRTLPYVCAWAERYKD